MFSTYMVFISHFKPFPKLQILGTSKLQGSAEDNFKFDENGIKFSIKVENTVGKREIAGLGKG